MGFCVAFEYMKVKHRLENKNAMLEEMEENLQALVAGIKALDDRELTINQEMSNRTAARDKQRGKELKGLEDGHSKLAKEIASTESKLKNRESDLEAQIESRKQSQTALGEIQKQVEVKEKAYQKEKTHFDALNQQH